MGIYLFSLTPECFVGMAISFAVWILLPQFYVASVAVKGVTVLILLTNDDEKNPVSDCITE